MFVSLANPVIYLIVNVLFLHHCLSHLIYSVARFRALIVLWTSSPKLTSFVPVSSYL